MDLAERFVIRLRDAENKHSWRQTGIEENLGLGVFIMY